MPTAQSLPYASGSFADGWADGWIRSSAVLPTKSVDQIAWVDLNAVVCAHVRL